MEAKQETVGSQEEKGKDRRPVVIATSERLSIGSEFPRISHKSYHHRASSFKASFQAEPRVSASHGKHIQLEDRLSMAKYQRTLNTVQQYMSTSQLRGGKTSSVKSNIDSAQLATTRKDSEGLVSIAEITNHSKKSRGQLFRVFSTGKLQKSDTEVFQTKQDSSHIELVLQRNNEKIQLIKSLLETTSKNTSVESAIADQLNTIARLESQLRTKEISKNNLDKQRNILESLDITTSVSNRLYTSGNFHQPLGDIQQQLDRIAKNNSRIDQLEGELRHLSEMKQKTLVRGQIEAEKRRIEEMKQASRERLCHFQYYLQSEHEKSIYLKKNLESIKNMIAVLGKSSIQLQDGSSKQQETHSNKEEANAFLEEGGKANLLREDIPQRWNNRRRISDNESSNNSKEVSNSQRLRIQVSDSNKSSGSQIRASNNESDESSNQQKKLHLRLSSKEQIDSSDHQPQKTDEHEGTPIPHQRLLPEAGPNQFSNLKPVMSCYSKPDQSTRSGQKPANLAVELAKLVELKKRKQSERQSWRGADRCVDNVDTRWSYNPKGLGSHDPRAEIYIDLERRKKLENQVIQSDVREKQELCLQVLNTVQDVDEDSYEAVEDMKSYSRQNLEINFIEETSPYSKNTKTSISHKKLISNFLEPKSTQGFNLASNMKPADGSSDKSSNHLNVVSKNNEAKEQTCSVADTYDKLARIDLLRGSMQSSEDSLQEYNSLLEEAI